MTSPDGKIYTLDEVAAHLRLTNRGVAKIAKQHGLCMVRGRLILFTDADIEAIKDVLRCPPISPRRQIGQIVPALSDVKKYEKLLALTAKKRRRP
jgi:hypothetical protein